MWLQNGKIPTVYEKCKILENNKILQSRCLCERIKIHITQKGNMVILTKNCRPLWELSKSFRIILIAFFLIEKNTKHPRKAGGEFINRNINHSRKIWKNHLKSRNIHSFLKIPTCLYLVYSLLSNHTDGAIILLSCKTDKSVSLSILGGFPSYLLDSVMVVPSYVFEVFICQISQV